jgi:hypothetical protein
VKAKGTLSQITSGVDIKSAEDIQDALKDLLGDTIQQMLELKWIITWI